MLTETERAAGFITLCFLGAQHTEHTATTSRAVLGFLESLLCCLSSPLGSGLPFSERLWAGT